MIPERHSEASVSSLPRDFESLSVSKRLVRSMSQKLRKKTYRTEGNEEDTSKGLSSNCLALYGRGGGCKVSSADTGDDSEASSSSRSSASREGKRFRHMCGSKVAGIDCFSYPIKDRFWKRSSNRRDTDLDNTHTQSVMDTSLPDDILEICFMRLPLSSLMNVRLVCKKWNRLTTTPRFIQMRKDGHYQTPWLFLFGAVKEGYCSGEIHTFDVALNKWHMLSAEFLRGRFFFSVASIWDEICIVGGCTSLSSYGKLDRSSFKTHKSVMVFNPGNKTWRRAASMKYSRSSPVIGVSEFGHRRFILIAAGGLGSWDEPLDSNEIYDSAANKWHEIQKLPLDFGSVSSGVFCRRIFFVYSDNDRVAGYDIERGYWVMIQTATPPSCIREYCPRMVASNGRVFMLMVSWCEGEGEIGRRNKAVRKTWELDLGYMTWAEVSTHPDAPMDWNAAFVADRGMIFGVEMFKMFGRVLDFVTVVDTSGKAMRWAHASRNRVAHQLDAASCMTKTMAVLHL